MKPPQQRMNTPHTSPSNVVDSLLAIAQASLALQPECRNYPPGSPYNCVDDAEQWFATRCLYCELQALVKAVEIS